MKILTTKKQKELLNTLAANQIIFNAFDSLDGLNKFEAFSKFCENTSSAIFKLGGIKALEEAKEFIFINDTNCRK